MGAASNKRLPNRLISEKSPYLLQHAYNPVDWYPWTEEAFEKAKKEDKPVFLSIGYSTCHWCHVMERESFEDQEVADLLNNAFVCIKVDREERPDLDQVYMGVCQVLTGSGGWPLTIIMTPDKRPFFAATYIPKNSRLGQIGMIQLIPKLNRLWKTRRKELVASAAKIMEALETMEKVPEPSALSVDILHKAYHALKESYDDQYGGFTSSPKFPSPHQIFFLLRYWHRTGREDALEMVENTLNYMRLGGIYDQIGFGFHRYSTDRQWLVPHFEKMLYDQALIAMAYLETFQVTGKRTYADTAREIFLYVMRDMASPEGGFYSAQDADTEGTEGKFYLWRKDEIIRILGKGRGELFCKIYNVKQNGNFKEESSGRFTGYNILHLGRPIDVIAQQLGMSEMDLRQEISEARRLLMESRGKRTMPAKDDKILTDWNGLMVAAMAVGARVLDDPEVLGAAKRCVDFLMRFARKRDGRLWHRYRDGEAAIEAKLDDYAFLVWGLIELYQSTFEAEYLREALRLNGLMMRHHWDPIKGGLFFTADDAEELIVKKKELYDGAVPSGNSVALINMLRLAHMTGDPKLEESASELINAFSGQVKQAPLAYTQFLCGVDFALGPSREVLIVGPRGESGTESLLKTALSGFHPRTVVVLRATDKKRPLIDSLAAYVTQYSTKASQATAYVCEGFSCKTPATKAKDLKNILKQH